MVAALASARSANLRASAAASAALWFLFPRRPLGSMSMAVALFTLQRGQVTQLRLFVRSHCGHLHCGLPSLPRGLATVISSGVVSAPRGTVEPWCSRSRSSWFGVATPRCAALRALARAARRFTCQAGSLGGKLGAIAGSGVGSLERRPARLVTGRGRTFSQKTWNSTTCYGTSTTSIRRGEGHDAPVGE